MPGYQLFFLTEEHKIVRTLEESHEDDAEAVLKARALAQQHTIDIWQDKRRVAMVAPGSEPLIFNDSRAP
jgi:hypothetical protein